MDPPRPVGWAALKAKIFAEPLVPFGALVTAVVLVGGIRTFSKGKDPVLAQKFMRARVAAQGFTLCAIAYGAYSTSTVRR